MCTLQSQRDCQQNNDFHELNSNSLLYYEIKLGTAHFTDTLKITAVGKYYLSLSSARARVCVSNLTKTDTLTTTVSIRNEGGSVLRRRLEKKRKINCKGTFFHCYTFDKGHPDCHTARYTQVVTDHSEYRKPSLK